MDLLRKSIERITPLTDEEWRLILEKSKCIQLKKGEFLQTQNSFVVYECFVLSGCFKTYIMNENGTETVIFFTFGNEWICDLNAFYHKKQASYNIRALEDIELIIITKPAKDVLFTKIPKLVNFHIYMIEKANIVLQQRVLDLMNKTSKERYADFIHKNADRLRTVNNKNLSSYLGISQEFLSRIKKEGEVYNGHAR